MDDCLFCKMVRGESPARVVKQDDRAFAFQDINPQAPAHILIIPKEHIPGIDRARPEHEAALGHLLLMAQAIAHELGLDSGYRIVINNGGGAGQTVFHIHVHLLGGRSFRWPPG